MKRRLKVMDFDEKNGLLWYRVLSQWLFKSGLYFDLRLIESEPDATWGQSQWKQLRDWCQRLFVSETYCLLSIPRLELPSPAVRVLNQNRSWQLRVNPALFEKIAQVFDLGG